MARPQNAKSPTLPPSPQPAPPTLAERVTRRAPLLALLLVILATARILSTYVVFHSTSDEPAHIACGMEWLDRGIYQYEHQHPPLTRILAALGPFLDGSRSTGQKEMTYEGAAILFGSRQYDRKLALARAGNLLPFWLACFFVYLWGVKLWGRLGAVTAVFLFTMLPTVLAHAGLATTDIGLTAFFAAAGYTLIRLLEEPSLRAALIFGLFLGLMVLSKFSALAFFPSAVLCASAWWMWRERRLPQGATLRLAWLACSALVALAVIWAGYHFSFGSTTWFAFRVPFPELFSGIDQVREHNRAGHLSYLLGEQRMDGWWLFFPVLLAVKTPLAVLALAGLGACVVRGKYAWLVLSAIAGILAVAIPANINIGLRHILPLFPFLALLAAGGVLWLLERPATAVRNQWVLAGLLLWTGVSSLAAHPDYLAYFNALAGSNPERIVVDSDLDWGQDLKRLGLRLKELGAPSVAFTPTVITSFATFGFPPVVPNQPDAPEPGWNAVQLSQWKLYRFGLQRQQPKFQVWTERARPVERVGESILLYYVSPAAR